MHDLIKNIIQSDNLYARFLNTLSLMEYTGARKIIKSQPQQNINKKMLTHMAEEMRHALVLKKAAMRIASSLCETYTPESLLCAKEAYQYFQTVDHAAEIALQEHDPWHCYLYTTFLIEVRILAFYATFEKILTDLKKTSVFRGILAEEENHLAEVSEWLKQIAGYEENIVLLKEMEDKAFGEFLDALKQAVL